MSAARMVPLGITLAFAGVMLAMSATADEEPKTTADQCILDMFNDMATEVGDLPDGATLKLTFKSEDLINHCEAETGTKVDAFDGVTNYSTKIGSVTFEME